MIATYIRDWYNSSECHYVIGKIYALTVGSDVLPILGICCFCCVYRAFKNQDKAGIDGLGAHRRIKMLMMILKVFDCMFVVQF